MCDCQPVRYPAIDIDIISLNTSTTASFAMAKISMKTMWIFACLVGVSLASPVGGGWLTDQCNFDNRADIADFKPNDLAGGWYLSHIAGDKYNKNLVNEDFNGMIYYIVPKVLDVDKFNASAVDFMMLNVFVSNSLKCSYGLSAWEWYGSKSLGTYYSSYYENNYYLYWININVLATDYTSTMVVYSEYMIDGVPNVMHSQLYVMVRDLTITPDAGVLSDAFDNVCDSTFADVSNDMWEKLPTEGDLPCATAIAGK